MAPSRARQVKPTKKHHHSFFAESSEGAPGGDFNLAKIEEKVLEFWKTNQIFEKSLEPRKGQRTTRTAGKDASLHSFVFFEGPPTANGKPGLHHILARAFKDIIPRFKTMQGFVVPRKGGWDTHGLPVEIEVEKQLGLKSKKEIEQYGIAAFNAMCRESVWKYKDMWEKLTERMGFWIDIKNAYVTYDNNYIESLWWIISEISKKKLLYKGHKIVPWCTRCGTGLSSHEIGQPGAYREVEDDSVFVKFKLKPGQKFGKYTTGETAYILSWTTTPWTLPGNVALAVGEKIKYTALRKKGVKELLIAASELGANLFKGEEIEIVHDDIKGRDLVGLEYEPLFVVKPLQSAKSHRVYAADFVTTTDGTGVVHTAVMYGEDDYALGVKVGLPQHHTVNDAGKFTNDVEGFAGMYVKSKETEKKIFEHLENAGTLLRVEPYKHEYPHCWRCSTPLLYYARSAWFVAMSKLRGDLLKNNKKIHWEPAHIKDGRFGEWLKDVKDWNFSRERYWGTPLPVWECGECSHHEVVGSRAELEKKAVPAKNTYYLMRHAFPETVMLGVLDSGQGEYHLTPIGRKKAERVASGLKKNKIDLIIASDILRTRETARIVGHELGVKVHIDPRIREIATGVLSGQPTQKYRELLPTYEDRFARGPEGGESLRDVKKRVWEFFQEIEKKYEGRNILLVSHEYPIWAMTMVMEGWSEVEAIAAMEARQKKKKFFIDVAEVCEVPLRTIPRDSSGNLDFHRPFIDAITLTCSKCKTGAMRRVKEICDVWYDSGAMPFASEHWPFAQLRNAESVTRKGENKSLRSAPYALSGIPFPADYISEAIDQTRGWFYTLLAVSTALGRGVPYKNVICLGLLNDKFGKKMSKSVGNVIDPWQLMDKYGVDAVRWYLYTMNPPGDPKNFDEAELAKVFRRVHLILFNSFLFWKTYGLKAQGSQLKVQSKNILDQWALTRLDETIVKTTTFLEAYQVREAGLEIERFIDDLSRWYIRRSRRRLQKPESSEDYAAASTTLHTALLSVVKLMAPFNPFFAEAMYRALGGGELSVHLDEWPEMRKAESVKQKASGKSFRLIQQMEEVRRIASEALAARATAGIKVRQPLAKLSVKYQASGIKLKEGLLEILKDEINVKEVVYDAKLKEPFVLDTAITAELREEGMVRELVRAISELRAKANLKPADRIVLSLDAPEALRVSVVRNEKLVLKETNAKRVEYKRSSHCIAESETKLDEYAVWLAVGRA